MSETSDDTRQDFLIFVGTSTRDARRLATSLGENGVTCVWAGTGEEERGVVRGIILLDRGASADAVALEQAVAHPDAMLISLAGGSATLGQREVKHIERAGLFMTVGRIEGLVFAGSRRARRFHCRIKALL